MRLASKIKHLTISHITDNVTGVENISMHQTYVTESKPSVLLDGTICQLRGHRNPAWGKPITSGKKECDSFSLNVDICKNLEKLFLGVPYL